MTEINTAEATMTETEVSAVISAHIADLKAKLDESRCDDVKSFLLSQISEAHKLRRLVYMAFVKKAAQEAEA